MSRCLLASLLLVASIAAACQGGGRHRGGVDPCCGAGPLVGGVTDDNVRLPEYLDYVAAYPHGDVPKIDLTDRRVIALHDPQGMPLWDAEVALPLPGQPSYRVRTNSAGHFLLPSAALGVSGQPLTLAVSRRGHVAHAALPPEMDAVVVPDLPAGEGARVALDIALVVDTTGSMADEVARLRATLASFAAQVAEHPLRPRVRVGGVAYRDEGDDYVTRPFDFTADLGAVQRTVDRLTAHGGGDEPEAVQQALEVAVERLSWRGEGTVRVLFLIGDAPPHFGDGTPYTVTLRRALERGIVIFPIACSDMNDTGEFVWRQLAAVTLGKFLFVSYGGTTEHHTGPYLENDLDQLMLRAVREQLDALHAPVPPPAPAPFGVHGPLVEVPAPAPSEPGDRVGFGRAPWDFGIPGWR